MCIQSLVHFNMSVTLTGLGFWDLSLEDTEGAGQLLSWQLCTDEGLWARQLDYTTAARCLSLL